MIRRTSCSEGSSPPRFSCRLRGKEAGFSCLQRKRGKGVNHNVRQLGGNCSQEIILLATLFWTQYERRGLCPADRGTERDAGPISSAERKKVSRSMAMTLTKKKWHFRREGKAGFQQLQEKTTLSGLDKFCRLIESGQGKGGSGSLFSASQ